MVNTFMYFNYKGNTPLHMACRSDNPHLIKILLDNNADIYSKNNKGLSPKECLITPNLAKLIQGNFEKLEKF